MDKRLLINICASSDSFGAYAENCDGIYAAGDSVGAVKKDVIDAISIYKEITPVDEWAAPIKEDWPIKWVYDTQSLLQYYQGILSNAAIERLSGINQKQLWNYSKGLSKPRKAQKDKLEYALHSLGQDLLDFSL